MSRQDEAEAALQRARKAADAVHDVARAAVLSRLEPTASPETQRDALIEAVVLLHRFGMDALHLAGKAVDELGSQTATATATRRRRAAGLARQAAELRERGRSLTEIAELLDRDKRTVERYFERRRNDETPPT